MRRLSAAIAVLLLASSPVARSSELAFVGGAAQLAFDTQDSTANALRYTAGFSLVLVPWRYLELESGALYTTGGVAATAAVGAVEIPFFARLRLIPGLAIGGGGYFSASVRTPVTADPANPYPDALNDYGAISSIRVALLPRGRFHWIFDFRYETSFARLASDPGITARLVTMRFLTGPSFRF